jgi:hypothetical protein
MNDLRVHLRHEPGRLVTRRDVEHPYDSTHTCERLSTGRTDVDSLSRLSASGARGLSIARACITRCE